MARFYRKRWTLETAFQHLEAYFHSEINTLGYPKAALFGFCLALVAYNVVAVVMAALRSVHGAEPIDQGLSLYYVANDIAQTYHGMMIAIPEDEWRVFSRMRPTAMVATLRELPRRCASKRIAKVPEDRKSPGRNAKVPPRHHMSPPPKYSEIEKSMPQHLNRAGTGTNALVFPTAVGSEGWTRFSLTAHSLNGSASC